MATLKVKREIDVFDVTGKNAQQIKTAYNTNYGLVGWRIIQIIDIGTSRYIVTEREL